MHEVLKNERIKQFQGGFCKRMYARPHTLKRKKINDIAQCNFN